MQRIEEALDSIGKCLIVLPAHIIVNSMIIQSTAGVILQVKQYNSPIGYFRIMARRATRYGAPEVSFWNRSIAKPILFPLLSLHLALTTSSVK